MEKAQNLEILLFLFYYETVFLLFYLPDLVTEEVERVLLFHGIVKCHLYGILMYLRAKSMGIVSVK